ncbi:PD40 domain-containing protein [Rufibacter sp. LB8]|uniref:TolB family protein n=1 Tax=Rufibacter sp. LB8 TaxID=2777781 RepID=UPI00178C65E9|nr:PD40 domain-containing protein [Rufibacter sp. LB8]
MIFKKAFSCVACLSLTLGSVSLQAQAQVKAPALQNIREVASGTSEYSSPVWSPDGQKLLFTDHHNDALYIKDMAGNGSVKKIKSGQGIGYKARWTADGKGIVFYEKQTSSAGARSLVEKSIDVAGGRERVLSENTSKQANRTFSARKKSSIQVYINSETLKLEAKDGNGKPWVITKEEGQFYSPLVSPDGKSVIVNEGANMYLYSINGNGKRKNLGMGLPSSWLPDGSGILTFEDESKDGHSISGSELYFVAVSNGAKTKLTNTPDRIEMWADVSPDGKKVAFSDEKSGKIYVADLKLKK